MATAFAPSTLSAADQAAFASWQQQLRQYVAQNGGGVPAAVSYALAHPEYAAQHPELQGAVQLVSGATLPASTQTALKDFHPVWGSGGEGFAKNKGLFGNWETWLQLGLGGALGGVAAAGALAGPASYVGSDVAGTAAAATPTAAAVAPAAVAPTVAPAATGGLFGMSTPLLATTAIGAGTGIANAIIQGKAATSAAQTQAQAAQTAAAQQQAAIEKARQEAIPLYQQAQDTIARNQAQGQAALAPYAAAGGQGLQALTSWLGVPSGGTSAAAPAGATMPLSAVAGQPSAGGGMVTLQAPNGQTSQVPAAQAAFYLARGAKRV